MTSQPLRIGFIGAGGIAQSHLLSLAGVRHAEVAGVFSPTASRREAFAAQVRGLDLGDCVAYPSLEAMLVSGRIDAVWMLNPHDQRVETMRTVHDLVVSGRSGVRAVACEKPLARTLGEAREMLRLAEAAGLLHGYLENLLFSTAIQRGHDIIWRRAVPAAGRPYIARAVEEHAGPRAAWFWQGARQGGGVLLDMMSHSVEVGRFLLTAPGAARAELAPVSACATIARLKWGRPEYASQLRERMGEPAGETEMTPEDFARGLVVLRDPLGQEVMIEATVSWAYVGPGLGTRIELLGPDYSMDFNVQSTSLKVFLGSSIPAGEDGRERQGLLPVVDDTAGLYGYTLQNRHFVEAFRRAQMPSESFADGVGVMEMLMALYRSAELGRTVLFAEADLDTYVPPVARPAAVAPGRQETP